MVEDDGVLLRARGIRYARADRYAAPIPLTPHINVVDATERGPVCPQLPSRLDWATGPVVAGLAVSEDCHVLSVTAPSDANQLPVMIWLHGGAYLTGSGEAPKYDADNLARQGRVVVVRVSYRLGVLGYLGPNGGENLGLRDQLLAVQWVHDNIVAFGGDPQRVTLFGQSAGADSVLSLMLCEQTAGLFQRAIMHSAPLGIRSGREAMTEAMRAALQTAATDGLLDAQGAAIAAASRFGLVSGMPFGPILGIDPLPPQSEVWERLAMVARRVELLIGYARHDSAPFVVGSPAAATLKQLGRVGRAAERATIAAMTRRVFGAPALRLARRWRRYGGRSGTFRVDWSPGPIGACHCVDLPLLFDTESWCDAPMLGTAGVDEQIAQKMRRSWASFAYDGLAGLDSVELRIGRRP